ncbi:MAG: Uma2 family endonuclease [Gemmataceae bacterium]|nr:Uma2 family endonuclease [Gemmataceae bacterium]
MSIASTLKLGPADAGRDLSEEDFLAAEYEPGYQYELIRGRLEVSPMPGVPQDYAEKWLFGRLFAYSLLRPDVINYVTDKSRVRIVETAEVSLPEPDVSAYHDFPLLEVEETRWSDVSPILVGESVSPRYAAKNLRRNPPLYLGQRSIQEYWVLDTRPGLRAAELVVHRRVRGRWRITNVAYGETYTTALLPEFELVVAPLPPRLVEEE